MWYVDVKEDGRKEPPNPRAPLEAFDDNLPEKRAIESAVNQSQQHAASPSVLPVHNAKVRHLHRLSAHNTHTIPPVSLEHTGFPSKSCNFFFSFSRPGKSLKRGQILEFHR